MHNAQSKTTKDIRRDKSINMWQFKCKHINLAIKHTFWNNGQNNWITKSIIYESRKLYALGNTKIKENWSEDKMYHSIKTIIDLEH